MLRPSGHDNGLDLVAGSRRHATGPRRPVVEAGHAFGVETGDPAVRALPGHAHRPSDVSHGHALLPNPLHQQASAMNRQPSITVTHEDLRLVKSAISTAPGVFAYVNDQSPTS